MSPGRAGFMEGGGGRAGAFLGGAGRGGAFLGGNAGAVSASKGSAPNGSLPKPGLGS